MNSRKGRRFGKSEFPTANRTLHSWLARQIKDATSRPSRQHFTSMELLGKLFERHYANSAAALKRFRNNLAAAKLSFDVEANVREQLFLTQAGFPRGMPSFIYYYIHGTHFGSAKGLPSGPRDPAHTMSSDGIGLNMGCPVRLAYALDALFALPPQDRKEPFSQLRARKNHFACVEELLWMTLWKQPTEMSRGGELIKRNDGQKSKDVDWFFFSAGTPIYLEVKYRPTDWLRITDQGRHAINDQFFGDIGRKFPQERSVLRMCVGAVTGIAEPITDFSDPDNSFFALCERKLLLTPGLSAILYRSLLGPIYVCSLEPAVVAKLGSCIRFPEAGAYPLSYPIVFNRRLREQRLGNENQEKARERCLVIFAIVPTNRPTPAFKPEFPYRFRIAKRTARGEPEYEYVPPFLGIQRKGRTP